LRASDLSQSRYRRRLRLRPQVQEKVVLETFVSHVIFEIQGYGASSSEAPRGCSGRSSHRACRTMRIGIGNALPHATGAQGEDAGVLVAPCQGLVDEILGPRTSIVSQEQQSEPVFSRIGITTRIGAQLIEESEDLLRRHRYPSILQGIENGQEQVACGIENLSFTSTPAAVLASILTRHLGTSTEISSSAERIAAKGSNTAFPKAGEIRFSDAAWTMPRVANTCIS